MIGNNTNSNPTMHLKRKTQWQLIVSDFKRYKYVYFLMIPVIAYYLLFHYRPLYGALIAFKDFNPMLGILGSKTVWFKHFSSFFSGIYAPRVIGNTLTINLLNLLFGFTSPILLALLLDEVNKIWFKRTIQTITYLPHFISVIVVCGIIKDFTSTKGLFNILISYFDSNYVMANLLSKPGLFRTIYIVSDIWQGIGWNSIIFLAALSGVDPQLYEAVTIDGGNRFHRVIHVSLPGILPTIIILLILRIGSMMNLGFEKIILLYSSATYSTSDVISSYVYRKGIEDQNFSFAAAVGLFNNAINFLLVISANWISSKVSETSLW